MRNNGGPGDSFPRPAVPSTLRVVLRRWLNDRHRRAIGYIVVDGRWDPPLYDQFFPPRPLSERRGER